jgi:hypothetical protein
MRSIRRFHAALANGNWIVESSGVMALWPHSLKPNIGHCAIEVHQEGPPSGTVQPLKLPSLGSVRV